MKELFVDWFGIAGVEIFHISIYMLCYCAICSLWDAFIRKLKDDKREIEPEIIENEDSTWVRDTLYLNNRPQTEPSDWAALNERKKKNRELAKSKKELSDKNDEVDRLTKLRLEEELRRYG